MVDGRKFLIAFNKHYQKVSISVSWRMGLGFLVTEKNSMKDEEST